MVMRRTSPRKNNTADTSSISKRIKPITSTDEAFAMCVYGRSGTGKTTFGATFPMPALLLDIREKGTQSVAGIEGLDYIQINEWEEIEQVYWFLKSGKHKYKTVILDQVSQMQDLAMSKAMGGNEGGLMTKKTWGTMSGLMKTWLLNYRELIETGMNVCFIAQDRTTDPSDTDEGDQLEPTVGPRLMPSVASFLNAAVSVIGNTMIRERFVDPPEGSKSKRKVRVVEYCMRIGPHASYVTKLRKRKELVSPDLIEDPSYDDIVALMKTPVTQSNPRRARVARRTVKE